MVTAFEVDRYQRWAQDFHIPRKYGFAQIYGENGGPGGMFHALRNMGPLLEVAHAMEELCPQAWLINYSNPEAKLVQAVATLTKVKVAGMCHGVFMGREQVSALLELPEEQIETAACGLNHFAWFQTIRHKETGEDLYPLLREKERQAHWLARWDELALSRILFRTFGLWPYPGTNHSGEYLRWAGPFMATEGMQYFYDPAETGAQASSRRACSLRAEGRRRSRAAFVYDLAGRPTETPLYGAEDVTQVYPTWESVTDGEDAALIGRGRGTHHGGHCRRHAAGDRHGQHGQSRLYSGPAGRDGRRGAGGGRRRRGCTCSRWRRCPRASRPCWRCRGRSTRC